MHELLNIAPDVADAMRNGRPVVALESTVIEHGLPRPQNLQTAHRLQEVVREAGSIPATIAIIDGKPYVGLNDDQVNSLANGAQILGTRGDHRAQGRFPLLQRGVVIQRKFLHVIKRAAVAVEDV